MRSIIVLGLLLMLLSFTANETVFTRFSAPEGYKRIKAPTGSFGAWLQNRYLQRQRSQY
jgi:hypothetical protein